MKKILYVLLCVTFPVLWGLFVSWLFRQPDKEAKKASPEQEEPTFPDYQI